MSNAVRAESDSFTRDPVCGVTVDPDADKPELERDGVRYHFCHESCRTKFETDPDAYIAATDPVCGMTVTLATAHFMSKQSGERFYYCSGR